MSTLGQPENLFEIAWWRMRERLRAEMDSKRFDYWISPLRVVSHDTARVVIACPTPWSRDQVVAKFGRRITDLIAEGVPGILAVDFVADPVQPTAASAGVTRRSGLSTTTVSATPDDSAPPAKETKAKDVPPGDGNAPGPQNDRRIKIEDIKRKVAAFYCTTIQDLESPCRKRAVVRPRQVAMLLARELSGRSYPEIARRFGGRDHTTVIYGCDKMRRQSAVDAVIAAEIDTLRRSLLD